MTSADSVAAQGAPRTGDPGSVRELFRAARGAGIRQLAVWVSLLASARADARSGYDGAGSALAPYAVSAPRPTDRRPRPRSRSGARPPLVDVYVGRVQAALPPQDDARQGGASCSRPDPLPEGRTRMQGRNDQWVPPTAAASRSRVAMRSQARRCRCKRAGGRGTLEPLTRDSHGRTTAGGLEATANSRAEDGQPAARACPGADRQRRVSAGCRWTRSGRHHRQGRHDRAVSGTPLRLRRRLLTCQPAKDPDAAPILPPLETVLRDARSGGTSGPGGYRCAAGRAVCWSRVVLRPRRARPVQAQVFWTALGRSWDNSRMARLRRWIQL